MTLSYDLDQPEQSTSSERLKTNIQVGCNCPQCLSHDDEEDLTPPPCLWDPNDFVPQLVSNRLPRGKRHPSPRAEVNGQPESTHSDDAPDAQLPPTPPSNSTLFSTLQQISQIKHRMWIRVWEAVQSSPDLLSMEKVRNYSDARALFMRYPLSLQYPEVFRDIFEITPIYGNLVERCAELGYNKQNTRRYWMTTMGRLSPFPKNASPSDNTIYWGTNVDYRRHLRDFRKQPTGIKIRIPARKPAAPPAISRTISGSSQPSKPSELSTNGFTSTETTILPLTTPTNSLARKRKRDEYEDRDEDSNTKIAVPTGSVKGKGKLKEAQREENVVPEHTTQKRPRGRPRKVRQ